jgi:hypothetical protein
VKGLLCTTSLGNARTFLEARDYVVYRVNDETSDTTNEQAISEPCINLFACPTDVFNSLIALKK